MKIVVKSPPAPNGVACLRCEEPIPVRSLEGLAEMFSVPCPRCGTRAMYDTKHHLKPLVLERRA